MHANRRTFAQALGAALLGLFSIDGALARKDDSKPGIPPQLPDAESQELYLYQNPYDQSSVIAVMAKRKVGWKDFIGNEEDVSKYVESMEYVEDAEPVKLLDFGGKNRGGHGFVYDKRDEADAAVAFRGYLSWEILGDFGYVALAAKEENIYMAIGLQENENAMEDILTWAVREGALPDPIGDFILRPVVS